MGKSIARGSKKALIGQCFTDTETRLRMLKKIEREVRKELKVMSSGRKKKRHQSCVVANLVI